LRVKLRQLLAQAGIDAAEQKVTEGLQRLLLEELHHRIREKVELALTLELSEADQFNLAMIGCRNVGSYVAARRTNWKNHRDDKIIGNCSGCNTPQLLDTYRILCPSWYRDAFDGQDYICWYVRHRPQLPKQQFEPIA